MKKGDRVELVAMPGDPNPLPRGSKGTVLSVQEFDWPEPWTQVCVQWDTDRRLMICIPPDDVRVIEAAQ